MRHLNRFVFFLEVFNALLFVFYFADLLWLHLGFVFFMPMFHMIVSFDTSFSSNCSTITRIYIYDIPYHRISHFPFSNSFLELHPDLVGWRTSSIRREYELAKVPGYLVYKLQQVFVDDYS